MNEAMWEDLFYGAVYGLTSVYVLTTHIWWCAALAMSTSLLWMLGGIGWLKTNAWRRILMPVLLCGVFFYFTHSGWVLVSLPLQIAWLYQGYGLPDDTDTGSWLGRICGKWTKTVWLAALIIAMQPMFWK